MIVKLADAIDNLLMDHPTRVAVNGRIASGKTTFAKELANTLESMGRPVLHVGVDGFHNPRAMRYRQGRSSARGYYEDAYDLAAVRRRLLDTLGKSDAKPERWLVQTASLDLETDQPLDPEPISVTRDTVLIVDGSFLLGPTLRDSWDYSIFLDVTRDVAAKRGARRDAPRLGGIAASRELHEIRYQAACDLYIQENRPEHFAQVVIGNDDLSNPELKAFPEKR
jgi:uridine kinase